MDDALFEVPDGARVEKPEKQPTTLVGRQMAKMRRGTHPLSMPGWPVIWLHKDAPPPDDLSAPGPRCGGCRFRELLMPYNSRRRFPKCTAPGRGRMSHSTATDVRGWWPACTAYEPKTDQPTQ